MIKELDKLKEIFLSDDVDSEDYQENLESIRTWEQDIIRNENLLSWQEHDITKEIIKKAKESYIDISYRIATDREISSDDRVSLFAKQEAMLWLMSITDDKPQDLLKQIESDIKKALNSV